MSSIDTSWSRLIDTQVGKFIMNKMDSDPRLRYHVGDHPRRMYQQASVLGIEYNAELDASILFHDSIYDELPDKELRSALLLVDLYTNKRDWFEGIEFSLTDAYDQILTTAGHLVTGDCDPTLLRLDLFELTSTSLAYRNLFDILQESKLLYNISTRDAAQGTVDFMTGFESTVQTNFLHDQIEFHFSQNFWHYVHGGVNTTKKNAQVIVDSYDRVK